MFQSQSPLSMLADEAYETATRYSNAIVAPDHMLYALCRQKEGREAIEGIYQGDPVKIMSFLTQSFAQRGASQGRPVVGEEMHQFLAMVIEGDDGKAIAGLEAGLAYDQILDIMIAQCAQFPVMGAALNYGNVVSFQDDGLEAALEFPPDEAGEDEEEMSEDEIQRAFEQDNAAPVQSNDPNMAAMLGSLRNITDLARQGKLSPVIGRDAEIAKTYAALRRHRKPNVLLVGEPGVGKTAIVEGLAQSGKVARTIIEVSMSSMMSGTRYRGDFEARVKYLVEFAQRRKVVLFIDEAHTLIGAGGGSGTGGLDAANMLKPALARGEISVILASTPGEMRALMKDKALARRFFKIVVTEPSLEDMKAILAQSRGTYETHHGVALQPESVEEIIRLSDAYLPENRFPDKAFDVLDHAALAASTRGSQTIDISDVRAAIYEMTGLLVGKPDARRKAVALGLEAALRSAVLGQEEAIARLSATMRLNLLGVGSETGCASAYLLNGPSGVGKTQTAQALAAGLGLPLVRIDMSDFMEKHTVSRLVGAPPGYVGYHEEGQLTAAVEAHPHMVLLLDEVEKAHPEVFDILLQVMDAGRLTSGDGRVLSFRGVHLVMTANIGASDAAKASIGFGRETQREEVMDAQVRRTFRPEFLERLTGILTYKHLTKEDVLVVIRRQLTLLADKFARQDMEVSFAPEVAETLYAQLPQNPSGRKVQRLVERVVADKVADAVLNDAAGCRLGVVNNEIVCHVLV